MASKGQSAKKEETNNQQGAFTLLTSGKPRWRSLSAGFGIEFAVLLFALWIPILFPKQMKHATHYVLTQIDIPYIPPYRPQPRVQPKLMPMKRVLEAKIQPKPVIDPPKRPIYEPVFEKLTVSRPLVRRNRTPAPQVNEWAQMMPDINTASLGSSAMPDLKKPRAPVQTGGFGDPEGLPATSRKMIAPVNINAAGDFNFPEGQGHGNGTRGKHGLRGTAESAGFGNQTAIAGGERNSGHVEEAGFANETQENASHERAKANRAPQEQPVVILYKPEPQYTAEGRAKKIQGSVVLQVVFKASGEVQVVRVVQGLGYGLDQNAELAAREIRFTPAKQDGQPVDFPASVRIDFELAY